MPQKGNCYMVFETEQPTLCSPICHSNAAEFSSKDCLTLKQVSPGEDTCGLDKKVRVVSAGVKLRQAPLKKVIHSS